MEQIYGIYGTIPPFQLSNLTYVPGGPWDIVMKSGGKYATIPNELIKQRYDAKRRAAQPDG